MVENATMIPERVFLEERKSQIPAEAMHIAAKTIAIV
jgi:hypothetical protein